jgi:hypothetical protein
MTEQLQINLSEQIRAAHAEAAAIADEAKGFASRAVSKALECGRLLLQQKAALGHGSWLEWVNENLSDISYETLARYMRVAKAALPQPATQAGSNLSPVTILENAQTLKQAYVALGILPQPEDKSNQAPDPNKPWVHFTRFIRGFRLWFAKRTDERPIDDWDEDMLRVLGNELQWFVNLHNEIQQRRAEIARAAGGR